MGRSIARRCSGGKLVKVSIEAEGGIIRAARITGDFFTHPEGTIEALEGRLVGARADQVAGVVREVLGSGQLTIGFNPEELIILLEECLG